MKTLISSLVTIAAFVGIFWIGRGPLPKTTFDEDERLGFQTTAPYPDNVTSLFIPTGPNVPDVISEGQSWYEVYTSTRDRVADRERKAVTPTMHEQLANASVFDGPRFQRTNPLVRVLRDSSNLAWMRVAEQYDSDDLPWIGELTGLRGLDLFNGHCGLHAADLSLLRNLTELQWLQIYANSYPPHSLPKFPKLEYLQIRGPITDQTLANLGSSPNLRVLEVSSSYLTDKALRKLADDCPNLQFLQITSCRGFTPSVAVEIGRMTRLRWLGAGGTQLEEDVGALTELQARLPECFISLGADG